MALYVSRCPFLNAWQLLDIGDGGSNTALSSFVRDASAIANTRLDWKETDNAHLFIVDLPGVRKEDVKVELVDRSTLRISGERVQEEVKETDTWHAVERSRGRFLRAFRLPSGVDVDSIRGTFENGVLTVHVPKLKPKSSDTTTDNGVNVKHVQIEEANPSC